MRRHAKVLVAIAALASFFAFAGAASAAYSLKGTFSSPGSEDGQLTTPGRAATEQATGNLFVVDSGNDRVQIFGPSTSGTATYLTQFGNGELSEPWGIAIDEDAGQTFVYVADAGNERIVKYASDEAATPSFAVDGSFASPAKGAGAGEIGGFKVALAVDPTTHDLLVADTANKRIVRLNSDGSADGGFDGSAGPGSPGAFAGPIDLAVNSAGDVYVIDATGDIGNAEGSSKALRYSPSGEHEAELSPVGPSQRPATVAVNRYDDSVVVSGQQDAVYSNQSPTLHLFDSANQALPAPSVDARALYDTVTGMAIGSDDADRLYVVFDQGTYLGSPFGEAHIQAFAQPHPTAPAILAQGAGPTRTEATLTATINPGNDPTTYHFEWGASAAYGNATAEKTIPTSGEPKAVSAQLAGLAEGTTYHFRVVASNSIDTVVGPDRTFTTTSAAGADNCSNAALRAEQRSAYLPDCRAFEQVSPADKNFSDVGFTASTARSSLSGDAFTFISTGAFAGAEGTGRYVQYLSRRTADGWTTKGITPPQKTRIETEFSHNLFREFSDDLSIGLLRNPDPAPVAGAPDTNNLYVRDNLTGSFSLVTSVAPPGADFTYRPHFAAASADFSHVTFESTGALTPDAPDDGTIKLYESVNGQIRLAGVMPDGSPAPGGSVAGMAASFYGQFSNFTAHTISDDGSRVFFTAAPQGEVGVNAGQLYVREDGTASTHINASHRTDCAGDPTCGGDGEPDPAPDPTGTQPALYLDATADGSKVLFASCERLTDDSTAEKPAFGDCPSDSGSADLYQYDVESGELELLSRDGFGEGRAQVGGLVGQSADGEYVYFVTAGALTPDSQAFGYKLYVWHEGVVRHIADLDGTDHIRVWSPYYSSGGKHTRVSADGQRLLFVTRQPQPGVDNNHHIVAYLYRFGEGVECISCRPDGGPSTTDTTLTPQASGVASVLIEYQPRALLEDGRAFFTTAEALVPADTNGEPDAYGYDPATGRNFLLSTGKDAGPSYFMDASANGDDLFFITRERLVGWDRDSNLDVYDAKAGGGFPEPPLVPRACQGEECQGPLPGVRPMAGVGSVAFAGSGNLRRAKSRCAKKQRRADRSGKARCAKRKQAKQKQRKGRGARRASDNRRVQR